MTLPMDVMAFYGALVVWVVLLGVGLKRRAFVPFLVFGVVLLVVLNARYAIDGAARSIAFFVGIYDVLHNVGVSDPASAPALATCLPDNDCSVWGPTYQNHPSWGVAFYQRFTEGNALRTNLLYGHIFFNTLAFVLMMVQLFRPGFGGNAPLHRKLGYLSLGSLTIGVVCASLLAAEHGAVAHYGGVLSMLGFWFMALCVYSCAVMGVVNIRRRDFENHRKWMFRYAGSMWGAFWLFRVMEFVLGPLLRGFDTVSILICIWGSAPLGIAIAEFIRRRQSRRLTPPARPGLGPTGVAAS
jgi:hypothetical protein